MKPLLKFILGMGAALLFSGCEQTDERDLYQEISLTQETHVSEHAAKMQTLGFNVTLYGTYDYQGPDPTGDKCGLIEETGLALVRNIGVGTGTHFKKVTSYFEFCVKPVAEGGGTYPEGYMDAYFEDENGDRLFIHVEGQVFPGRVPGMPNFALSYFKDPFTILGGTGKFEGASGSGYTNDYNFIDKDGLVHTSHHWQGTLIMKKGR